MYVCVCVTFVGKTKPHNKILEKGRAIGQGFTDLSPHLHRGLCVLLDPGLLVG